ncbi:hypothetical protein [Delftia acidovorans]|uniref:hypothetical protein n=1 Tax=Delftia acidovorans TaxID=80866 RepID=UPI00301B30E0
MSEARKPTPGPWIHGNWLKAVEGGIDEAGWCEVWMIEADGVKSLPFVACKHQDMQANAALIAEAGTVHHETGLTPRQLVDRMKAVESAMRDAREMIEADHVDAAYQMLGEAITNLVKGATP